VQPSEIGQPQELLITSGARDGRIQAVAVGRSEEELETLAIRCRRAVTLIHIATPDPLRSGRHTDCAAARGSDHGAGGVGAVAVVIAGERRISAAAAATAVDRVMPVVIVIGTGAIPAAILAL